MKASQVVTLVTAITLAILAILTFAIQVFSDVIVTKNEVALVNVLQFILSIGFTWQAAKFFNYESFVKSIKKYAISAYRRISDIDYIVGRLNRRITEMLFESPSYNDKQHLRVVREIVSDTQQIIASSVADWSDVIEEEISTIQSIKDLETRRSRLELSEIADRNDETLRPKIEEIRNQIETLRKNLPSELRYNRPSHFDSDYSLYLASDWLANRHLSERGLHLLVVTGGTYGSYEEMKKLKGGEVFETRIVNGGHEIYNRDRIRLGRVFNDTPFDYHDFVLLLSHIYATDSLKLCFVRIARTWENESTEMAHVDFQVMNSLGDEFKPLESARRVEG